MLAYKHCVLKRDQTFTCHHLYYYSAVRPILILLCHGGPKAESFFDTVASTQPAPALHYHSGFCERQNCLLCGFDPEASLIAVRRATTRPLLLVFVDILLEVIAGCLCYRRTRLVIFFETCSLICRWQHVLCCSVIGADGSTA